VIGHRDIVAAFQDAEQRASEANKRAQRLETAQLELVECLTRRDCELERLRTENRELDEKLRTSQESQNSKKSDMHAAYEHWNGNSNVPSNAPLSVPSNAVLSEPVNELRKSKSIEKQIHSNSNVHSTQDSWITKLPLFGSLFRAAPSERPEQVY
jgi:hypothetical protein